jgi:succinoglycan biosynthesis transport protein ExoP
VSTFEKAAPIEYRSYVEAGGGSGVSMAQLWDRIGRRKWFISVLSTLLFGCFSAILFLLPLSYTTSSEIVVEQRPQGVDLAAVLSRIPTDSQAVLTEAEALQSRALVHRTISQLNLLTTPEFNPRLTLDDGSLRSRWRQAKVATIGFIESLLPASGPSAGDPVLNEATDIFLKRLRVLPVGRSHVLKASFTSENPELASEILNTLVGLYLATQMENRVAVPAKMGDFLKGELDRLQAKVRDANDAVERYRNEAKLQIGIVQGREVLLHTQELSDANRELVSVRIKRQEAEARLSEIRANPNSFPDVLGSALIQQVRRQISLLKEERSQLVTTYGRSYPKLREIEASIADAERRVSAEIGNVVRSIASDVTVLTEREAQLVQSVAALKDEMQKAGSARVTLASLQQEAEVNRSILSTFLTQYNQLTSQRALQIADSYVLAPAGIPTRPSFPPRLPLLGLAFVVSVALGALCALLLERPGKTIRSSQEVQPLLTARSLGVIPKLESRTALLTQVIDGPQSQFTESIRSVLFRFMAPGNPGRVVLVASAQSGEGRTSLATALARLAALSGRRAIIIDCDLRRPALHDAFGVKTGPGLTDVLQNRSELSDAIRRDTLTPLDYITAGEIAPHAATLLCLPEMADLLAKLRTEYDLLVLDSPPSATVADTSLVAQLADECLFVVSWNKTPWRLAREQMDELSQHCSLTGVVLNQVDMRRHSSYYLPTMVASPTATASAPLSLAPPGPPTEIRRAQPWFWVAAIAVSLAAMAAGWWLYRGEVVGYGRAQAAAMPAADDATPINRMALSERTETLASELTAAAAQQAAERTAIELREAVQQERDKAETLVRDLVAARREIETQTATGRATSGEIARMQEDAIRVTQELQRSEQRQRERADALERDLAAVRSEIASQVAGLSKFGEEATRLQQMAERSARELRQTLQQERENAEKIGRELATARRELETQAAALTEAGDNKVQSQQRLTKVETSVAALRELLAHERARNQRLEQQLATRQAAAPGGSSNATTSLQDVSGSTQVSETEGPARGLLPTREDVQPVANRSAPMAARPPGQEASDPELQHLMSRASLLLKQGDVGAARIVLERAVEMGSALALFVLAQTFDPFVLSNWGTLGTQGDVEKARVLYGNAFAGGVQEAKDRLAALPR